MIREILLSKKKKKKKKKKNREGEESSDLNSIQNIYMHDLHLVKRFGCPNKSHTLIVKMV